jgi:hypothetical protein
MSMKPVLRATLLCVLELGLHLWPTLAATPTASFGVTATVQATCTASVSTTEPGLHSTAKPTAAVSVTCNPSVPYMVGVNWRPVTAAVTTPDTMDGNSSLSRNTIASRSTGTLNRGPAATCDKVARARDGSAHMYADRRRISAQQYIGTATIDGSIAVTVTY